MRSWTRAWGQREFADKRTGHLQSPTDLQDPVRVGWTIPSHTHPFNSSPLRSGNTRSWYVGVRRSALTRWDDFALIGRGPVRCTALSHGSRGAARGSSTWSSNALAHSAVSIGDGRPFPKPAIPAQHVTPGLLYRHETLSDDLGSGSVDEQWPGSRGAQRMSEATRLAYRPDCEHKRGEQESERAFHAVPAHFHASRRCSRLLAGRSYDGND